MTTLYEFSFTDKDGHGWYYTRKVNVLAKSKEEAMEKFLNAFPDEYSFAITMWWNVDIL